MLIAKNETGERIRPEPSLSGLCPMCDGEMIAKCGDINIWHWAHKSECPYNYEIETAWHRDWKQAFPPEWIETVIVQHGERHRADVFTDYQIAIEFQHSSISYEDIRKREQAYTHMIWVFDCIDANEDGRIIQTGSRFEWMNPKKIFSCRKPMYLDIGKGSIIRVKGQIEYRKGYTSAVEFDGHMLLKTDFIKHFNEIPIDFKVVCPPLLNEVTYFMCHERRKRKIEDCLKSYWPWARHEGCQQWKYPMRINERG